MSFYKGKKQYIMNIMGPIYSAVLFLGVSNSSSVHPIFEVERTVLYKEKAAGMCSALPYALGEVAIKVPFVLIQSIIYAILVYSMISFDWTDVKLFWFLYFMFFTFLYYTYNGMMSVALTPSYHIATIVSSAFYSGWNLFCGIFIPRPRMPVWWRWYSWATPVSWTLYGLIASQLGDVEVEMETTEGKVKVARFIKSYLEMRHDFLGIVALVLMCIPILFVLMFSLAIKYLNIQKI